MNQEVTDILEVLQSMTEEMRLMHETIASQHSEICRLSRLVESNNIELHKRDKVIEGLNAKLAKYESPDKNSGNSSTPPSKESIKGVTIMRIYRRLDELTCHGHGFHAVLSFLELLYDLSLADDCRTLSSSSFAHIKTSSESRRVNKVQQYIASHFREEVRLEQIAELVGMTPVGFSRFFHQRTGRTLSDYIIEIRLGFASRMLIDTTMTAAEICYDSGFNTLSNFNRLFRKYKGCTPTEFRENYNKKKIII